MCRLRFLRFSQFFLFSASFPHRFSLPFFQSLLPIHSPISLRPPLSQHRPHSSFHAQGLTSLRPAPFRLPQPSLLPSTTPPSTPTSPPKMLSAPVKSAKRISSLFSLGSHKDQNSASNSPATSPSYPPADSQNPRRRSQSRPTRHVSTPNAVFSEPRTLPNNGAPMDRFDLESLPPPPSLTTVNHDLASSAPSSPGGRPQSRGREMSRPTSSVGLAIPGSTPQSRPGTPSKRRSWMPGMPGRSRASSMERRPAPPMLPSAWIAGLDQKVVYDLGPLSRGEQVC